MLDLSKVFLSVAEVSEVVGIKPATASQWILLGFLGGKSDRLAEVPGATTYLGVQTAMELAIAAKLRRLGAGRDVACKAGKAFAGLTVPKGKTSTGATISEFKSWLIVSPKGEITVASLRGDEIEDQKQEDGWHLYWPLIAQQVMQHYASRLPRGKT